MLNVKKTFLFLLTASILYDGTAAMAAGRSNLERLAFSGRSIGVKAKQASLSSLQGLRGFQSTPRSVLVRTLSNTSLASPYGGQRSLSTPRSVPNISLSSRYGLQRLQSTPRSMLVRTLSNASLTSPYGGQRSLSTLRSVLVRTLSNTSLASPYGGQRSLSAPRSMPNTSLSSRYGLQRLQSAPRSMLVSSLSNTSLPSPYGGQRSLSAPRSMPNTSLSSRYGLQRLQSAPRSMTAKASNTSAASLYGQQKSLSTPTRKAVVKPTAIDPNQAITIRTTDIPLSIREAYALQGKPLTNATYTVNRQALLSALSNCEAAERKGWMRAGTASAFRNTLRNTYGMAL